MAKSRFQWWYIGSLVCNPYSGRLVGLGVLQGIHEITLCQAELFRTGTPAATAPMVRRFLIARKAPRLPYRSRRASRPEANGVVSA